MLLFGLTIISSVMRPSLAPISMATLSLMPDQKSVLWEGRPLREKKAVKSCAVGSGLLQRDWMSAGVFWAVGIGAPRRESVESRLSKSVSLRFLVFKSSKSSIFRV